MAIEQLVVGGGCFWCTEAIFQDLRGVESVESGYAGGSTPNPSYRDVCTGATGHAEVIRITFDSAEVERADLLRLFLTTHDPTTLNRQGGDVGTQYRSVIFYRSPEERELAEAVIDEVGRAGLFADPIVTTLEQLTDFYVAEDYHQNYYRKFETASMIEKLSMNAGYCQHVVGPKVAKFRKQYADRLRK